MCTGRLGHNGTCVQGDWETMGLMHRVTGTRRGLVHRVTGLIHNWPASFSFLLLVWFVVVVVVFVL